MNIESSVFIFGRRAVAMAFALTLVGTALSGEDGPTPDRQSAREPVPATVPDSATWGNPFIVRSASEQLGAISRPLGSTREISGKLSAESKKERRAVLKSPKPIAKKKTGSKVKAARLDAELNVDRFIALFDHNRNGGIEREEFYSSGNHAFGWLDRDSNGVISRREVRLVQARLRGDARRRARSRSNRKAKAIPAKSGNLPGKGKATAGVSTSMEPETAPDMGAEMGSAESSEMMAP